MNSIPTAPDQTMQSLLAVHRYEVAILQEKLDLANQNLTSSQKVSDWQVEDIKRLKETIERNTKMLDERDEKITKLQGVIDALKLDLGNEREAHTKARQDLQKLTSFATPSREGGE